MRTREDLQNRFDKLVYRTESDWGIDSKTYVETLVREKIGAEIEELIQGYIEGLTVPELLTMLDIAEQAISGTKTVEAPKKKASKPKVKQVQ